jgi:hypothetical protein
MSTRLRPSSHVFFNAKDVGMGVSGTYEGDQAELTGTAEKEASRFRSAC